MARKAQRTDFGLVRVSDAALAEAAALAALNCAGVAGLGQRGAAESLAFWFGAREDAHGVSVETAGARVAIKLFLYVEYGADMAETALAVQEAVAEAVETMSGLEVRVVDVVIQGVRPPKGKAGA